jgi:antitoxin ParD1/3/4
VEGLSETAKCAIESAKIIKEIYTYKPVNINIDIPDEVRVYVEVQVIAGAYSSIGAYFLDLVQQDQKRKAQAKLEALLLKGINSEAQEVTPEYWHNLRSAVLGENSTVTPSDV